jgi:MFS family permease
MAWLTGWLLGGLLLAAVVLPLARSSWPAWVVPTVIVVFGLSFAGPFAIAGGMLGRILARGADRTGVLVGALFALGVLVGPVAGAFGMTWFMWGGFAALGLGLVGLVLVALRGRIAAASRRRRARRIAVTQRRRGERRRRRVPAAAHDASVDASVGEADAVPVAEAAAADGEAEPATPARRRVR